MKNKDQRLLEEAYDAVLSSSVKIPDFKFMQSDRSAAGDTVALSWDLKLNGETVGKLIEFNDGDAKVSMVAPDRPQGFLDLNLSGFGKGDTTIEKFKLALQTKTGQRYLSRLKELGARYIK